MSILCRLHKIDIAKAQGLMLQKPFLPVNDVNLKSSFVETADSLDQNFSSTGEGLYIKN